MDIFTLLDKFNQELDAKRRDPFVLQTYALRLRVVSAASTDDVFLIEETSDMETDAGVGELDLFSDVFRTDRLRGFADDSEDLDLIA